jgi:hypothetical protein
MGNPDQHHRKKHKPELLEPRFEIPRKEKKAEKRQEHG